MEEVNLLRQRALARLGPEQGPWTDLVTVWRGRWFLPGGWGGRIYSCCTSSGRRGPRAWNVFLSQHPDGTQRSDSVMEAAGRAVRRDPEAAAGARSVKPPHRLWVSWVSGLGMQEASRAAEAHVRCGVETHVQGESSHWTLGWKLLDR